MLSAFANCFKIPELRQRILFTLCVIVVVRIGAAIPCPGINTDDPCAVLPLTSIEQGPEQHRSSALFNLFSGGALENCAVFTLGIMPYISASIMLQLMTAVVPSLGKLAREEGGRQKITQYTRYATIVICVVQGLLLREAVRESRAAASFFSGIDRRSPASMARSSRSPGLTFEFTTVISLLAGTLLLMWLGEQITDKGIGNGISMVITVNIVSRLPAALVQGWQMLPCTARRATAASADPGHRLMIFFLFAVIAGDHRHHAGPAQNHHPVRQAGARQQGLRRPDAPSCRSRSTTRASCRSSSRSRSSSSPPS